MKNYYKFSLSLLLVILIQCTPTFLNAQVSFLQIYPTITDKSGRDVIATSDGGYLITGMTTTFIAGDTDVCVIKTDYLGNLVWSTTYGGSQPDYAHSLIATSDGNYFLLGFSKSYGNGGDDIWLVKINPSGSLIWSQTYGTTFGHDRAFEIISTSDGNYAITGFSNSNAYLAKIDLAGNVIWSKNYGGGQFESSYSLKQCLDGGYILAGQTYSYGQGGSDIYIIKTDPNGDTLWTKTFGGAGTDCGNNVLANSDGTYAIACETNSIGAGDYDMQLIKTDASGNFSWTQTYGGNVKDVTKTMEATPDGGYIISGISRSFGWINPNFWIVKVDAFGNMQWNKSYGSWYHDHGYTIRLTSDGGYIVIGHSEDSNALKRVMFVKEDASIFVSVQEFALNDVFSVYPNPTEGIIKIDIDENALSSTVKISNSLGQIMFLETIDASNTNKSKIINLKDKEPGIYFVSIQSSKGLTTKKIILN